MKRLRLKAGQQRLAAAVMLWLGAASALLLPLDSRATQSFQFGVIGHSFRNSAEETPLRQSISGAAQQAPAFIVAQMADYVDLDGPLLLAKDRQHAIQYHGSLMQPPPRALWG